MNLDYIIKNYDEKYWEGVSELYREVFGKDLKYSLFTWKNAENPQGKSIIKVAVNDEEIIGFSCICKFYMNLRGNRIFAGQSVDAMVSKEYRKRGIFEKMAMEAIDEMKRDKIALRFNFPNEAAYLASVNKINIKKVCDIPQYIKIIKGREALSMFSKNKLISLCGGFLSEFYGKIKTINLKKEFLYDIRELNYFDKDFDDFWENIKKDYPIIVERSSKYLNWRYFNSPEEYKVIAAYYNNEVVGYLVASIEKKESKTGKVILLGHIADFLCNKYHKQAGMELITAAEKYLKDNGVCAISCWMVKEWFYSQLLTKCAYLHLRSPSVLAVLPIGNEIKETSFIYDYKNWYVTIGDSDYI